MLTAMSSCITDQNAHATLTDYKIRHPNAQTCLSCQMCGTSRSHEASLRVHTAIQIKSAQRCTALTRASSLHNTRQQMMQILRDETHAHRESCLMTQELQHHTCHNCATSKCKCYNTDNTTALQVRTAAFCGSALLYKAHLFILCGARLRATL